MKVGYLITGRLKLTRLPKKLLREIKGKPVLCHMFDRLKLAKKVDQIILCTSPLAEDRPLVELAAANGVACHCGDPDDVILRLLGATQEFGLDYCLNITADSPFADPAYADKIVEAYLETKADLIRAFGLPHGAFSYGIRPEALAKIVQIKDSKATEVWGKYFTDTGLFRVYDLPIDNPFHNKPHLRMTLDYPEDLLFFEAVFDALHREGEVFTLDEILELLERRPEIVEINRHCHKPFKLRWLSQAEIRLKPRFAVAKAAVIGCGSIGQRHVRNLRKLGIAETTALRMRQGHFRDLPAELEVREVCDWSELLAAKPDIAVVSNPTSLHLDAVRRWRRTSRESSLRSLWRNRLLECRRSWRRFESPASSRSWDTTWRFTRPCARSTTCSRMGGLAIPWCCSARWAIGSRTGTPMKTTARRITPATTWEAA